MARCIRVSRFNGLYHQLEKLSVYPFDLKIHLVHMTDKEQWQDKHSQPYYLQPREEEGEHDRERARNKIIEERIACDPGPCLTNGDVRRPRHGESYGTLVDDKKNKNHRCKRREVQMNSIESSLPS